MLEFVRGLTRERELGLSAVLKARVDAIKQATGQLLEGLHAKDADLLRQAAIQLAELFRQISRQLDQDRHAILELAEKVKAQDANLPIARRYREVYGSNAIWQNTHSEFQAALARLEAMGMDEELAALCHALSCEGLALEHEAAWLAAS